MLRLEDLGEVLRIRMARTLLGRPMHQVSAYLVDGLLVDAGPPPQARALAELARCRGVEAVAVTHHHEDHVGACAEFVRRGLPVYAPATALSMLRAGPSLPLYRRLVWGGVEAFSARPLGDVIEHRQRRYRVLSTPGHAFDHVVLYDEERRWLFGGDLFVHERVHSLRRIESVHQHLASLRRMLDLRPAPLRWFCAHAGVMDDPMSRLEAKVQFWEQLGETARELLESGVPPGRISRQLLGAEGWLTYLSFGDFSKRNLIRDLLRGEPSKRYLQSSRPLPPAGRVPTDRDMLGPPAASVILTHQEIQP